MNTLIDSNKESPRRSETKVVGIDIGGTEIKMAAFSAAGKMMEKWVRETNDHPGTGVPEFAETVRKLLRELNEPEIALGIAAPHRVRIVPAVLGEWAGTFGAAWSALNSTPVIK